MQLQQGIWLIKEERLTMSRLPGMGRQDGGLWDLMLVFQLHLLTASARAILDWRGISDARRSQDRGHERFSNEMYTRSAFGSPIRD
jgi:hypothetical protein